MKDCLTHVNNVSKYSIHKKSFEVHVKVHEDAPLTCNQCGKKFKLPSSLSNHVKSHQIKEYICKCEDCQKVNKSYSMHLEPIQYGHIEKPTICCNYCDIISNTDTNVCT